MLDYWGGPSAFGIYMCIGLYIYRSAIALDLAVKLIWISGIQGIYAQLLGGPSAFGIYMCIGLYIYRSAIALDLAVKLIWCSSMQGIYA